MIDAHATVGFSGINLDSCPNCDGVWLQKGELARLHGGDHITETTLKSAAEQLDAAERYKEGL